MLQQNKCLRWGIKNRHSVLKRAGKSEICVLNMVRVWLPDCTCTSLLEPILSSTPPPPLSLLAAAVTILSEGDIGVLCYLQYWPIFMSYFGNVNLENFAIFSKPAGCVYFPFWFTIVSIKTYPSLFFQAFLVISGLFGSIMQQPHFVTHFNLHVQCQGCALRAPGCLRWLTSPFGWPDNLISFIQALQCMLGNLDLIVGNLWAPCNFS